MDIKPKKSIYDLSIGELIAHYSDEFKLRNNIVLGTKIPVLEERTCWVCKRTFLGTVYEWHCSDTCQDKGDWEADRWDLDR